MNEIQAIIRQITASVTFLPLLQVCHCLGVGMDGLQFRIECRWSRMRQGETGCSHLLITDPKPGAPSPKPKPLSPKPGAPSPKPQTQTGCLHLPNPDEQRETVNASRTHARSICSSIPTTMSMCRRRGRSRTPSTSTTSRRCG